MAAASLLLGVTVGCGGGSDDGGAAADDAAEDGAGEDGAGAASAEVDVGTPGLHEQIQLGDRTFDLYGPPSYDGSRPTPAVLVLHGRPSTSADMRERTGMNALADAHGFLAVYPQGNGGLWRPTVSSPDVDFVRSLVGELTQRWHADPERIYVTGYSNGADMAATIGVTLPDVVTAVAPVSPTGQPVQLVRNSGGPMDVILLAGANDRYFDKTERMMTAWREAAGCAESSGGSTGAAPVAVTSWACAEGRDMEMRVVADRGHAWFGSDPDAADPLSASQVVWEFFAGHPPA